MEIEQYLSQRSQFIEQHSSPPLLAPLAPAIKWIQSIVPMVEVRAGANFGGSFLCGHGAGWDIWIDIADIAHGVAQEAGSWDAISEAILLHEVGHLLAEDEAQAWKIAGELWCNLPQRLSSPRELMNCQSFYLASHDLGRCPMPGGWQRLSPPEAKPAPKPKPTTQRASLWDLKPGSTIRIPHGGMAHGAVIQQVVR